VSLISNVETLATNIPTMRDGNSASAIGSCPCQGQCFKANTALIERNNLRYPE
jgi:hypothetical protein